MAVSFWGRACCTRPCVTEKAGALILCACDRGTAGIQGTVLRSWFHSLPDTGRCRHARGHSAEWTVMSVSSSVTFSVNPI